MDTAEQLGIIAEHVKATINSSGCQFGAITRERVDSVRDDIKSMRGLMQAMLLLLLAQLISFAVAAFWYIAGRVH